MDLIPLSTLLSTAKRGHLDRFCTPSTVGTFSAFDQVSNTAAVPGKLQNSVATAFVPWPTDLERRLQPVADIGSLFSTENAHKNSSQQWITRCALTVKLRLVEAISNMRFGRRELASCQAPILGSWMHEQSSLAFWIRCGSLSAAVLLLSGERYTSVLAHKEWNSSPLSSDPTVFPTKARINFAAALSMRGQSHAAREHGAFVRISALTNSADLTDLHAAHLADSTPRRDFPPTDCVVAMTGWARADGHRSELLMGLPSSVGYCSWFQNRTTHTQSIGRSESPRRS